MSLDDRAGDQEPWVSSGGVINLSDYAFEALQKDGDLVLHRGCRPARRPAARRVCSSWGSRTNTASLGARARLKHEYSLTAELDPRWAAHPVVEAHLRADR